MFRSIVVVFQWLNHVWLYANPWTATHQASLSFTIFQSLLKLTSIASVMPSNHLILCRPFSSCTWSFPASGSFLMTWLFASGVQSIGTSASALPMNIQGWFPLELPGLILLSDPPFLFLTVSLLFQSSSPSFLWFSCSYTPLSLTLDISQLCIHSFGYAVQNRKLISTDKKGIVQY